MLGGPLDFVDPVEPGVLPVGSPPPNDDEPLISLVPRSGGLRAIDAIAAAAPSFLPATALLPDISFRSGVTEQSDAAFERTNLVDAPASYLRARHAAYAPIVEELNRDRSWFQSFSNPSNPAGLFAANMTAAAMLFPILQPLSLIDHEATDPASGADRAKSQIFAEIRRRRQGDPGFLKGIPDTAEAFEAQWTAAVRKRVDALDSVRGRGEGFAEGVAGFAGGMAAFMTDPIILAQSMAPIGGSRSILGAAVRGAAVNALLTASEQPRTAVNYDRLGMEFTAEDAARNVGFAALGGGLLAGGGKAVGKGFGTLREGGVATAPADDRALAEAFREAVPEEMRTPTETAALQHLERDLQIREASPFEPGPAGESAHGNRMQAGAYALASGRPAAVPRATVRRSELLAGTADPSSIRFAPREQVKAKIRRAESSGDDGAKNPDSSASGRYQFTLGTWLGYYKRRYGGKEGNQAIWAKRFNGDIQDVLMNDLLADNAAMLREAGAPETAGNLYLLHFAGPDGLKVLRAAPDTPVERLLSKGAIASNKTRDGRQWLRGMKAGDLIAWANRKMGGKAAATEPRRAAEPGMAERADAPEVEPRFTAQDFEPAPLPSSDRPALRADLYALPEEHARAQLAVWREQDAIEGFAAIVDDPPAPGPAIAVRTAAPRQRSGPVDVMQAIADAGGLADNEGHALVQGRNIPKFMLGAGSIIRPNGAKGVRSLDAMGEHLWERGYFGPAETTPRPTTNDVLQLLERGAREKVYLPEEAAEAVAARPAQSEEDVLDDLVIAARDLGHDLDPVTLDDALSRRARGSAPDEAVEEAVAAARHRDVGEPAGLERFDDPDGEGVRAQLESLEHDLRMAAEADDGRLYTVGEEGETMRLGDLMKSLDEDQAAVDALRGCMAPPAVG